MKPHSLAAVLIHCVLLLWPMLAETCDIARAEPPGKQPASDSVSVSPAERNAAGELVHVVRCPYQSGPVRLRVLLPEGVLPGRGTPTTQLPVVYVLPVEAGSEHRYGDGLEEIRRSGLHRRHRAIWVAPEFSQLPWYADHPTDNGIHQEAYLLRVVLPFVEKHYPARAKRDGRLLLGFSKSGWGAWTLLLRRPDLFERAAAWDAPLMMEQVGRYGNGDIFGTQENFQRYRPVDLLERQQAELRKQTRLILTGYGSFRQQHIDMHGLLDRLQIPHIYRDGPQRKHDWHSGWVAEAVDQLLEAELNQPEE